MAWSIVTSSPRTSWSTATATAYLGDFGLAKHASSPSSLTGEQSFVGTIAYVAPEQIKGEQVDGRADVYALACVLYEALTGRTPFERESELAVLFAHLHERAPRASDVRPELPPGLDHVLRTGTAKEPKERYASCAELVAAARGALAGERGPRTPVRARTVALAGVVSPPPSRGSSWRSAAERSPRRRSIASRSGATGLRW